MTRVAGAQRDVTTLFFGELCAGRFVLSPEDSHHAVRVLRHQAGDHVWCIDGSGSAFEVELEQVDPRQAAGTVTSTVQRYHEPALRIELLCGMTQPARMDWVVEKATELGVYEVRPVLGAQAPGPGRVRRWHRIARGASKQCQRGVVPLIYDPAPLAEHLHSLGEGGLRIWAERGGGPLPASGNRERVVLAVGHDTGFSDRDEQRLREAGFQPVDLGERRLRTETAVVAMLSRLLVEAAGGSLAPRPDPEIP